MASVKSLAKDTAVYGLSSIIGRFLNWLLVPLYTNVFADSEYGVVSYIYAIVAVALIVLTYGLETGFFRFANHERYGDPMEVYSTAMTSLAVSSTAFLALVFAFIGPVSEALKCPGHESFALLMAATVAIDAFTALPFSYLRFRNRSMRFAALKLISIAINIGLNIFFILICPWLWEEAPGTIAWFYDPTYGIGYIFLANFISSAAMLLLLIPEYTGFRWKWNRTLWREMLVYSYPLLILGVAGVMNQTVDKIMLPWLIADKSIAMAELGIYAANYKIAVVMVMFIQAFRFAYEPFIFAQNKARGGESNQAFRDAMKYFVIFSLVIFLGVMYYLDLLRWFIAPEYFSGLKVVPVVMIAEFFFGVFFNLSLWYKLTDRTIWGTWFSLIGVAITVSLNIILVPYFGYMGCAWAALCCYGTMMLLSYFIGKAKHPIGYDVKSILIYFFTAMALYALAVLITTPYEAVNLPVRTLLLAAFIVFAIKREHLSIKQLLPKLKH
ncbi:MAG: oligosaccharide flippase family protein [Paramuribaculum sp.]|nr:oligosaccharide flippase family protein [Paramuribaculum sp.]